MVFLIFIAVLALLVWALILYRNLNLAWGLGLVLLVGSCFGHAFFNRSIGPLPITLDRVIWGLLIIHLGVGIFKGRFPAIRFGKSEWILVIFLGVIGANLALTNAAFEGMYPVAIFLFFLVMPAGCYLMMRQVGISDLDDRWLTRIAIGFGLYLALTAFAESRGWLAVVFPRYIANPEFSEFFGRGRGPFLNPVVNGMVMIGCMITALCSWPIYGRRGRFLLVGFTAIMLLGCYSTLTRTVWISAAFSLGFVVFISVPRERKVAVLASVLMLGGLVVGGAWDQLKAFKRDRDVSVTQMAQSASLRPLLATVAIRMAKDRPVLGHGFAQYPENCVPYHYVGGGTQPVQMARPYVQHNVVLALLVDTGIIGVGVFLALLARWCFEAWKVMGSKRLEPWQRRIGLLLVVSIACYLINGMFHDVLIMPMANMYLFSVAGLSCHLFEKQRVAVGTSVSRFDFATSQAAMPQANCLGS